MGVNDSTVVDHIFLNKLISDHLPGFIHFNYGARREFVTQNKIEF